MKAVRSSWKKTLQMGERAGAPE